MKYAILFFLYITICTRTAVSVELVLNHTNTLIKRYANHIIKHRGKDQIYVPSEFLKNPTIAPRITGFSSLVQRSMDISEAIVEYAKQELHQTYQDPRYDFEKTHSRLKRNELIKEIAFRPKELKPLTFNNLDIRRAEKDKYRLITTNEIDMTSEKESIPILLVPNIGVSVVVILANIKKKTVFVAHAMETSILDNSFKGCVKEILDNCDNIGDIEFSMLTTNMARDFRVIEGIQNKLSYFFKNEMMLKVEPKKYVLYNESACINVFYDTRDNTLSLASLDTKIPFLTKQDEIEYILRNSRLSIAWFLSDFIDRRGFIDTDINERIRYYFNERMLPFQFFANMTPLGVQLESSDSQYLLTTKEDVLQHFFNDIL